MNSDSPSRAFILHKREYRETSYLVDAFCVGQGKVSFVAKGVRSAKSGLKSLLQPFQPVELQFYGKHQLKNLAACESVGRSINLQGKSLYCGLYLNELLNRLLLSDYPCDELFEHYQQSLLQLAAGNDLEPVLREFELNLLQDLGYGFDFSADATQNAIAPDGTYQWIAEQGFVPVYATQQLKHVFIGADLLAVAGFDWTASSMSAAKLLCRMALQPLLGSKPLKSRELFMRENS
ncbi:DNA repair protein RecO [Neptunicella marina]|uniref:DNA repair protein RecO n=1 Tax=Neptunicella marina TaxID=2125989 RepID=A0A8J6IW92_9ALTE|nr:DNA repair protein RecO [Neptunicella marina]MBC3766860.1 DNA repair protein RecO [Neptunicella marina]